MGSASDMPDGEDAAARDGAEEVLPLAAERLVVTHRRKRTRVRVARTTTRREPVVDEPLAHSRVVVERVPVGRVVDAVPPIREVDGVTIIPVVEEVVVTEKRLVLREEVHVRQVSAAGRHTETVVLREQQVEVTRTDLDDEPDGAGASETEGRTIKGEQT